MQARGLSEVVGMDEEGLFSPDVGNGDAQLRWRPIEVKFGRGACRSVLEVRVAFQRKPEV